MAFKPTRLKWKDHLELTLDDADVQPTSLKQFPGARSWTNLLTPICPRLPYIPQNIGKGSLLPHQTYQH